MAPARSPPAPAAPSPTGAVLLVLGASALFGTTGTTQALGPPGTTPLGVGAVRLAVGGAALLLAALAERGPRRAPWRSQLRPLLLAGLTVASYQLLWFTGLRRTGVALGTIVGIGSCPVFAGVVERLTGRGALPRAWLAGTALTIAGVGLLVGGAGAGGGADPLGIACMLGAGLSYALYAHATKTAIAGGVGSTRAMALAFGAGALLLAPLLAVEPLGWLLTPRGVAVALHLGAVTIGLAYWLYGRALRTLTVPTVATLTIAEPLVAALLGVLVLGERLDAAGVAGALVIAAGLVTVARSERAGR